MPYYWGKGGGGIQHEDRDVYPDKLAELCLQNQGEHALPCSAQRIDILGGEILSLFRDRRGDIVTVQRQGRRYCHCSETGGDIVTVQRQEGRYCHCSETGGEILSLFRDRRGDIVTVQRQEGRYCHCSETGGEILSLFRDRRGDIVTVQRQERRYCHCSETGGEILSLFRDRRGDIVTVVLMDRDIVTCCLLKITSHTPTCVTTLVDTCSKASLKLDWTDNDGEIRVRSLVGCTECGFYSLHTNADESVMHPLLDDVATRTSRSVRGEQDASYWTTNAQEQLWRHATQQPILGRAKNVILFLGDGMSIPTLAATRAYLGQRSGQTGEEVSLSFEQFPYTGLSKTYCVDRQVADSACTSTAYFCGVKNNYGTLGVSAAVTRRDCQAMRNSSNHVDSILAWAQVCNHADSTRGLEPIKEAITMVYSCTVLVGGRLGRYWISLVHGVTVWQDAGKSTGLVTTTRITHASPAGGYSHTAERNWESDADVASNNADPHQCADIAKQLVRNSPGKNVKSLLYILVRELFRPGSVWGTQVVLGGGRRAFRPNTVKDEEGKRGVRIDGVDLVDEWKRDKLRRGASNSFAWDRNGLLGVNTDTTEYLLGLFDPNHMQYHLDADPTTEPTLPEMTATAIKMLQKDKAGFFLFVEGKLFSFTTLVLVSLESVDTTEQSLGPQKVPVCLLSSGGRIDHAHHGTSAKKALDETVQFHEAVRVAAELTDEKDTLIVVTSDHAHVMSYSGYPTRGNDILGIAGNSIVDRLPYSTISYGNGPGYRPPQYDGRRYDISRDNTKDKNYMFPALLPLNSETHGGDDVGVFARGPWAHLFTGVYEQHVIPHMMAFASCIGRGLTACWAR
uniref:alkaline phosphatase n=1 Tax=Timema monikensis TaxID=170555 RepID=A0A7R9HT96_9NEOP|nr:unnamed protein product [Timema monikensis]